MSPAFLCYYSSPKKEQSFIPINMSFGKIFTNTYSSSCQKQMDHNSGLRTCNQIKVDAVGGNLWKIRDGRKSSCHLSPSLATSTIYYLYTTFSIKACTSSRVLCLFSNKSLLECHCNVPGIKGQFVKGTHRSVSSREPHQHFNQSRVRNRSCPHRQDYQGYCNFFILIYSAIKYLAGSTEDQNAFKNAWKQLITYLGLNLHLVFSSDLSPSSSEFSNFVSNRQWPL